MRIALLGGTGDIGEGLALRWGLDTAHELVIGSRDHEKADQRAAEYRERISEHAVKPNITGATNVDAVDGADVVVLSVPPAHVSETVETVGSSLSAGSVIVSPAVSMSRDGDGFHYERPSDEGSITAIVNSSTPDGIPTVGAFHNISADRLTDLDADLDVDTVVVGDDEQAKSTVTNLIHDIEGLRAVDGGSLANASEVEAITPLLINIAMNNSEMHHLGVRFQ
jgi:NADPH-dependent F420 reductase